MSQKWRAVLCSASKSASLLAGSGIRRNAMCKVTFPSLQLYPVEVFVNNGLGFRSTATDGSWSGASWSLQSDLILRGRQSKPQTTSELCSLYGHMISFRPTYSIYSTASLAVCEHRLTRYCGNVMWQEGIPGPSKDPYFTVEASDVWWKFSKNRGFLELMSYAKAACRQDFVLLEYENIVSKTPKPKNYNRRP